MSGFAGMISLNGAPPDRALLEKMAARLAFRGPDGTHITTQPGAGFCFTFLRTGPAPQCPSQPCSLDGRVWLLGDVRLDGRDDVRRKLEQHGDTLATDATDEELVLRVWQRWGEDGIAELIGDYAFALWDAEARVLRCWRDLMGARPFFYAQAGGWFYFSNTLDTVRSAPGISPGLDHHFIGDFLLEGLCLDASRTVFRDISRVPGGRLLRYSRSGIEVQRYTSLAIEGPLYLKEEDYVEQFRNLLEQAVLERLPRGQVAIFMSGGLDSTGVAAVAVDSAKKAGFPLALRAYTVDCGPELNDQEGRLASAVARQLGISIEIRPGISGSPLDVWKNSETVPEPLDDPYLSYPEQFRLIAQHARVVLNGYGGDGIMTGQTWPYLLNLARERRFGEICRRFGGYILKQHRIPPLRGGFRSRARRLLFGVPEKQAYPPWLTPAFAGRMPAPEPWSGTKENRKHKHPWYPDAYKDLNEGRWASVLETEDAAWTLAPVESRAPLLDFRIQRFLLRVPPIPLCISKELLRRALKSRLPEEVRVRPKTPFGVDLLAFHTDTRGWTPFPFATDSTVVREFVDFAKLSSVLKNGSPGCLWRDLRPLSLLYWLNSIDRAEPLQS